MHITLQDLAFILLAYCVAEYDHAWATGVCLVLVQIDLSCPHARCRLILFINAFTLFPWVLFGFAALI